MTFVFTIAAVYSSFIGSKGFAGFDLAPIVSLAQAMYSGQSFHDFVDNAFFSWLCSNFKIDGCYQ